MDGEPDEARGSLRHGGGEGAEAGAEEGTEEGRRKHAYYLVLAVAGGA